MYELKVISLMYYVDKHWIEKKNSTRKIVVDTKI